MKHHRQLGRLAIAGLLVAVSISGAPASEDKPRPKITTDQITLPDSVVKFDLVRIPAGKITLKDKEGKPRDYEIKPIWIGRTEVTWDEYDVFWMVLDVPQRERAAVRAEALRTQSRPSRPYSPPDRDWGHAGFPAGSMQYLCAKAYCAWLSKNTGHTYRLPTEAEWEYACRAGAREPVSMSKADLEAYAWFEANSKEQTQHVASKRPNAWGLYDMLGNVARMGHANGWRAGRGRRLLRK
jgi:formylglycine-generating enzyme required for sulfatase activity